QAQPLPHAARIGADTLVGDVFEPHACKRIADPLGCLGAFQPHQPCGIGEVLAGAEVVVEADLVGQVSNAGLDRQRLAQRIEPVDAHAAFAGLGEAQQQQDRRCLARAVGPEKTEDLALADLEVDVIHRDKAAIALGQPPGLDDAGHRRPYLEMPKASTTTAAAMTPSPVTPHSVDVSTVTRKLALSEAPSPLARTDTT